MQKCIVICGCKPCREFINISRCGVLRKWIVFVITTLCTARETFVEKKIKMQQYTFKYFCRSTHQTHHLWTLHSWVNRPDGLPDVWNCNVNISSVAPTLFETMTALAGRHNFSPQQLPETIFALDSDPGTTANCFMSALLSPTTTHHGIPWLMSGGERENLVLGVPTGTRAHDWWVLTDAALFVRAMMMVCKRAATVHPGWEKIAGYLFKFLFKFMTAIYI